ncbi:chondroitin sulfate N-acetylgalactosaminyltransferase 1-like [Oscarella lobularis]|uniref:chondroitin sulfate N-acetylgalactosaminyltransferase 1-like n=1 Tax=Oscarella lobularis TaxID=121494 RepID=UPI003313974D
MKFSYSTLLKIGFATLAFVASFHLGYRTYQSRRGRGRPPIDDATPVIDSLDCDDRAEYLMTMLRTREEQHRKEMERLRAENHELTEQLDLKTSLVRKLQAGETETENAIVSHEIDPMRADSEPILSEEDLRHNARPATRMRNEYEVIPWESFTKDRLYHLEDGLAKRPEERPFGERKKEHGEIVALALKLLNAENPDVGRPVTRDDLLDGYARADRTLGTQYELFFTTPQRQVYRRVQLFRPYAPVHKIHDIETLDKSREWINLIMPLQGRVDKFRVFMEVFAEMCVRQDKRVFLTIVYFGVDGRDEVKSILETTSKSNHFRNYKFLTLDGPFSRGRGLAEGAEKWEQNDVLMFFCDVDIWFDVGFLDRCRLNASPGKKVYYPMVFSLYNPGIVYADKRMPRPRDQLIMRRDTGFWRDFGFGMTCQYRSDFISVKGFDKSIEGWGGEDVKLYRKYVKSGIVVIRSTDRGMYHLYHEKYCDPKLSKEQYKMCLGSKALAEASHSQLGMLAFKNMAKSGEN